MDLTVHLFLYFSLTLCVLGQDPIVSITDSAPPMIRGKIEVQRHEDVTMDCYIENKQQDTTIRWNKIITDSSGKETLIKISDDLSVEDNTKNSIEKPTTFTWRLRIKNVNMNDGGKYTCFVYTTIDNRKDVNVTVDVKMQPIFDMALISSDMTVREGDTLDLFCNATGLPAPTIEWSRLGGGRLPNGKEVHYEPKMTILGVKPEDRGKYRCRAYNFIGGEKKEIIRDITMDVKFRPVVTAAHREVMQAPGYLIELQCLVEMNPYQTEDSSLVWVRGALSMSQSIGRFKINHFKGAFNKLFFELIIDGVQDEDYGQYKCQVKNTEGIGAAAIALRRADEPQPSYKIGIIQKSSGGTSHMNIYAILTLIVLVWSL